MITRDQAREIAAAAHAPHKTSPFAYHENWPHAWILDAIVQAYELGAKEARAEDAARFRRRMYGDNFRAAWCLARILGGSVTVPASLVADACTNKAELVATEDCMSRAVHIVAALRS